MRSSLVVITLIFTLAGSVAIRADTLGVRLGAYRWSQDYSGDIRSSQSSADSLQLASELGFSDDSGSTVYAVLEHPIPLIPNIMLRKSTLEINAKGSPGQEFNFGGEPFAQGQSIASSSDLSHQDIVLYYEVLDNWLSLDIGIAARSFDHGITLVAGDGTHSDMDIDDTVAMVYLGARAELPLTGLYLQGELNSSAYGDVSLLDYQLGLGYESDLGLGLEAGLRRFELDYKHSNERADLAIDGVFVGVYYHF